MHDVERLVDQHRHRAHHQKAWHIVEPRYRLAQGLEKAGGLRDDVRRCAIWRGYGDA